MSIGIQNATYTSYTLLRNGIIAFALYFLIAIVQKVNKEDHNPDKISTNISATPKVKNLQRVRITNVKVEINKDQDSIVRANPLNSAPPLPKPQRAKAH